MLSDDDAVVRMKATEVLLIISGNKNCLHALYISFTLVVYVWLYVELKLYRLQKENKHIVYIRIALIFLKRIVWGDKDE